MLQLAVMLLHSIVVLQQSQTPMPQLACRLWELFTLPPVISLEQRKVVLYLSRSHGGASNGGRQVCVQQQCRLPAIERFYAVLTWLRWHMVAHPLAAQPVLSEVPLLERQTPISHIAGHK